VVSDQCRMASIKMGVEHLYLLAFIPSPPFLFGNIPSPTWSKSERQMQWDIQLCESTAPITYGDIPVTKLTGKVGL
jgi:hypothetical protein